MRKPSSPNPNRMAERKMKEEKAAKRNNAIANAVVAGSTIAGAALPVLLSKGGDSSGMIIPGAGTGAVVSHIFSNQFRLQGPFKGKK